MHLASWAETMNRKASTGACRTAPDGCRYRKAIGLLRPARQTRQTIAHASGGEASWPMKLFPSLVGRRWKRRRYLHLAGYLRNSFRFLPETLLERSARLARRIALVRGRRGTQYRSRYRASSEASVWSAYCAVKTSRRRGFRSARGHPAQTRCAARPLDTSDREPRRSRNPSLLPD